MSDKNLSNTDSNEDLLSNNESEKKESNNNNNNETDTNLDDYLIDHNKTEINDSIPNNDSSDNQINEMVFREESQQPKKKNKRLIVGGSVILAIIILVGLSVTFAADIIKTISPTYHLSLASLNTAKELSDSKIFELMNIQTMLINGAYEENIDISFKNLKLNSEMDYSSIAKNINFSVNSIIDRKSNKMSNKINAKFLSEDIVTLNTYFSNELTGNNMALNLEQVTDDYLVFNTHTLFDDWNNSIFANSFYRLPVEYKDIQITVILFPDYNFSEPQNKQAYIELFSKYMTSAKIENGGKETIITENGEAKYNKTIVTISVESMNDFFNDLYTTSHLLAIDSDKKIKEMFNNLSFAQDVVIDVYTNNKFKIVKCNINTDINNKNVDPNDTIKFNGAVEFFVDDTIINVGLENKDSNAVLKMKWNEPGLMLEILNLEINSKDITINFDGTLDMNNSDTFIFNINNLGVKNEDTNISIGGKYTAKTSANTVITYPSDKEVDIMSMTNEEKVMYIIGIYAKIEQFINSFSFLS